MSYQSSYSGTQIDNSIKNIIDDVYVNESGDTMTGNLKTNQLYIDNTADIQRIKFNNNTIERAIININANNRLNFFSFGPDGSGFYEQYYLPTPDNSLTANISYPILTKKNYLDMIYPVGSIYISTTNSNPSSKFGGTWSLVSKQMAYASGTATVTLDSTNASAASVAYMRVDGTLRLRISVTNKVAINDTAVTLFTIDFTTLGVSSISYGGYITGHSDAGECIVEARMNTDGTFQVVDVVPVKDAGTWAAGNAAVFDFTTPIHVNNRLDSACDRFFFKRTA